MTVACAKSIKVSGRVFDIEQLQIIRQVIDASPESCRAEIAREVCNVLDWRDMQGQLKAMSCRVALLRLHKEGLIKLPKPRNGNGNKQKLIHSIELPAPVPVTCKVNELDGLRLQRVESKADSALWNALIDQYHYLGYRALPGAQLRYLIQWNGGLLGAIGWAAAAWKVAPRDEWIGWDAKVREAGLQRILNNARFLILPWIQCHNLASKVLSMSERCVPQDFQARYAIQPVLLETFVEKARFRGTCYRAANWQHLGHTQGRGKCDRNHQAALPIKDLYVRPLTDDFRRHLEASS